MTLCDQYCKTHIHFIDGKPYNDADNKPHVCPTAQRAREFEGHYNMIQIKRVRQRLDDIDIAFNSLSLMISALKHTLDWQEEQNKPLAEAFEKRKQAGRQRNYEQ